MTEHSLISEPSYKFNQDKKLSIILAPFSGGQKKRGVENGPKFMMKHGIQKNLAELGWSVSVEEPLTEQDNIMDPTDFVNQIKNPSLVGRSTKLVYDAVKSSLADEKFALTLGGDHSIAMGSVSAVIEKFPDCGLLWIDAHADINTLDTTDSGNLHGCPVSFLMGLNDEEKIPESMKWIPSNLQTNKIAYIGLRDLDHEEKVILKKHNIAAFTMYHVDRYGINNVIEMALKAVNPTGEGPMMCSYDVDALDPLYVPATGTPVRGGLTLREGLFIVERLAETGNLVALDVVECNPDLALNDIHVIDTISTGCAIARCALGETLL